MSGFPQVLDGRPDAPSRRPSIVVPVVSPAGKIKQIIAKPADKGPGFVTNCDFVRWSSDLGDFLVPEPCKSQGWTLLKDMCEGDGAKGKTAWRNYLQMEEARKRDRNGDPTVILRGQGFIERIAPPTMLERRAAHEKLLAEQAGVRVDDVFAPAKRGAK